MIYMHMSTSVHILCGHTLHVHTCVCVPVHVCRPWLTLSVFLRSSALPFIVWVKLYWVSSALLKRKLIRSEMAACQFWLVYVVSLTQCSLVSASQVPRLQEATKPAWFLCVLRDAAVARQGLYPLSLSYCIFNARSMFWKKSGSFYISQISL